MRLFLVLAIIATSVIFYALPEWDIAVSRFFYVPGEGFPWKHHLVSEFFYYFIRVLSVGVAGYLCGAVGLYMIGQTRFPLIGKWIPLPTKRIALCLIAALLLGPGALVHYGFKPVFERARPVNTTVFEGVKTFTPAWVFSDQGGKSFISGHASMGFFMAAMAYCLACPTRRKFWYAIGLTFGFTAGFMRVMQGSHFLSDILLGGFISLLVAEIIVRYFGKVKTAEDAA